MPKISPTIFFYFFFLLFRIPAMAQSESDSVLSVVEEELNRELSELKKNPVI